MFQICFQGKGYVETFWLMGRNTSNTLDVDTLSNGDKVPSISVD